MGCPYCKACFYTFEEWTSHAEKHRRKAGGIENWSFLTMLSSLLHNHGLSQTTSCYDWRQCNWSSLKKEGRDRLRFALERWTLPPDVKAHVDYVNLDIRHALAEHAFRLGTVTGSACNSRTFPFNPTGTTMSTISSPFATSDFPSPSFLDQQRGSALPQGQHIANLGSSPDQIRYD